MTNPNQTHLALIVDRSGSMHRIADDMNGAIKTLFQEQAAQPGELLVDVWSFDDTVEHPVENVTILSTDLEQDFVQPRGSTALNDAIGKAVVTLGERFAAMPEEERPAKVILVIVTDGMENASKEYPGAEGRAKVKAMLETQKADFAWEVLFFGASSIDAFAAADGYGVARGQTISFGQTHDGVYASAGAASSYIINSRSGVVEDFTDEEREAAAD